LDPFETCLGRTVLGKLESTALPVDPEGPPPPPPRIVVGIPMLQEEEEEEE
jgi:hypothetical protein